MTTEEQSLDLAAATKEVNDLLAALQTAETAPENPAENPVFQRLADIQAHGEDHGYTVTQHSTTDRRIKVWDTRTGAESIIPINNIVQSLRKRREDGTMMYTTTDPGIRPATGQYKCMLHPDDPNREKWNRYGFPTCTKKLISPYEVEQHMQKKHRGTWRAIEVSEQRERERRRENFERRVIESRPPADQATYEAVCDVCGVTATATAQIGANAKLRAHGNRMKGKTEEEHLAAAPDEQIQVRGDSQ